MKRIYEPPRTEVEKICLENYGILANDTFHTDLGDAIEGNPDPEFDIDAKEEASWDLASPWEE